MADDKRGYSWPPFEPGHTLSLKHGADSPRQVQPVADELEAWLHEAAPWTRAQSNLATVKAWAWAEARAQLIRSWLDQHEAVNDEGEVPAAATYLERIEARAARLREELAQTPQSKAKLLAALTSIAVASGDDEGLAALKAEGGRILDARRAELEREAQA